MGCICREAVDEVLLNGSLDLDRDLGLGASPKMNAEAAACSTETACDKSLFNEGSIRRSSLPEGPAAGRSSWLMVLISPSSPRHY
jgi:hypothetical protein